MLSREHEDQHEKGSIRGDRIDLHDRAPRFFSQLPQSMGSGGGIFTIQATIPAPIGIRTTRVSVHINDQDFEDSIF